MITLKGIATIQQASKYIVLGLSVVNNINNSVYPINRFLSHNDKPYSYSFLVFDKYHVELSIGLTLLYPFERGLSTEEEFEFNLICTDLDLEKIQIALEVNRNYEYVYSIVCNYDVMVRKLPNFIKRGWIL